jgi:nicotinate-nucleotide pyrophosphorylase (carboxylating)
VDDVPRKVLGTHTTAIWTAELTSLAPGVTAGIDEAIQEAYCLGLSVLFRRATGDVLDPGDALIRVAGPALAILRGEDHLTGYCAKASGVATAARWFVEESGGRLRVVCGAFKKYPLVVKDLLRSAIAAGGAAIRILDEPFVYLDKNYIKVLGGLDPAIRSACRLRPRKIVVQVRGEWQDIVSEAERAAVGGADVIMVDTGDPADARLVSSFLSEKGYRPPVQVAFGGGVDRANFASLLEAGTDIVDVGRGIIDAPSLDLRYALIGPGQALPPR